MVKKTLLIVESPSKATVIGKYLPDYTVLSSGGHIMEIERRSGAVHVDDNFRADYKIIAKAEKNIASILKAAKHSTSIYFATDRDREGEAIAFHLCKTLKDAGIKTSFDINNRVVFNEITKSAIEKAIQTPRKIDMNLTNAQQARQILDYLIGFTLSPVLWKKLPGSKSAGRVQSAALRIICERDIEIRLFKKEEYWSIHAVFACPELIEDYDNDIDSTKHITSDLVEFSGKKLDKLDIKNEQQTISIIDTLRPATFVISNIEKKLVKRNPPPPFTTSTMIQDAVNKLGFSAKQTSQIAQKLYEGISVNGELIGLITYIRTDSTAISQDAIIGAKQFIETMFGDEYATKNGRQFKNKVKNAQEAHESIRPTNVQITPEQAKKFLDSGQAKLYELIWRRFVASQMAEAQLENTTIIINAYDKQIVRADYKNVTPLGKLRSSGSVVKFPGFYRVSKAFYVTTNINNESDKNEKSEQNGDQKIPRGLTEDMMLEVQTIDAKQHFTQPPPRYTEGSLVKKMEELGIGRPSTYSNVITTLQSREYVKIQKKQFFPEAKGVLVNALLVSFFEQCMRYDFTAHLEELLDDISNGDKKTTDMLNDFWNTFNPTVDSVLQQKTLDVLCVIESYIGDYLFSKDENGISQKKCPKCNDGTLILKNGKYGPFLGCSNYPLCDYIRNININEISNSDAQTNNNENGVDNIGDQNKDARTNTKMAREIGCNEDGGVITVQHGPYGPYVSVIVGKKRKNVSVPKGIDVATLSLEHAKFLLAMPFELHDIQNDVEKNKVGDIVMGIGKFGPYLKHNGKYTSIKVIDDVFTMTYARALEIIAERASKLTNKATKDRVTRGGAAREEVMEAKAAASTKTKAAASIKKSKSDNIIKAKVKTKIKTKKNVEKSDVAPYSKKRTSIKKSVSNKINDDTKKN